MFRQLCFLVTADLSPDTSCNFWFVWFSPNGQFARIFNTVFFDNFAASFLWLSSQTWAVIVDLCYFPNGQFASIFYTVCFDNFASSFLQPSSQTRAVILDLSVFPQMVSLLEFLILYFSTILLPRSCGPHPRHEL